MLLKVYSINETIEEVELDNTTRKNIDLLFNRILSDNGSKKHLIKECILPPENRNSDSVLYDYYLNRKKFDYIEFAQKLLKSELNNDGERNKKIQNGYLFIKVDEDVLYLMKLEQTEVLDTKSFERIYNLGTGRNYYKICIFANNFNNIQLIDKSRHVANYWKDKFLDLTDSRNSDINTTELIDMMDEKILFTDNIYKSDNYQKILKYFQDYIFNSSTFDKEDIIVKLFDKDIIHSKEPNLLFSDESSKLDSYFDISKAVIRSKYKRTIKVSKDTVIKTDNLINLKRQQRIELRDGCLIIDVESDFLPEIKKLLEIDDND